MRLTALGYRSLWSRLGIRGAKRTATRHTTDSEPRPQGAVRLVLLACLWTLCASAQDALHCECDHATHAGYDQKNCGLCAAVDKAPTDAPIESNIPFVKDSDAGKPHRWLALSREHAAPQFQLLSDVQPDQRAALWPEATARANQKWRRGGG